MMGCSCDAGSKVLSSFMSENKKHIDRQGITKSVKRLKNIEMSLSSFLRYMAYRRWMDDFNCICLLKNVTLFWAQ